MSGTSPPPPPTGVLYRVDGESLNTLIEKYEKSLTTNASEQERLDKLRQEYVTLRSRLTTLPQKVEHNALVPLGRRALCPGKIIHTNEIMCLLGDNWFVECSAVKAIEIVNHRIAKLDEQHEGLRKERELINNWKQEAERQLVETIGEGTIEIREDYIEAHEEHWKERHRESVRRYHQQLAKEREEAKQEKNKNDNELWTRLDELEIQEELEEYIQQEEISEEKIASIAQTLSDRENNIRASNNHSTRSTQAHKDNEKPIAIARSEETIAVSETSQKTEEVVTVGSQPVTGKRVKFSADNIIHDISDDTNFTDASESEQEKSGDIAAFSDDSSMQSTYPCFDPIMIRFRHTPPSDINNDEDADTCGTEEEDQSSRIVSSPGDIVKVFGPTSINAISNKPLPKSILKPYAPPLLATDRKLKKAPPKAKKTTFSVTPNEEDEDVDLSEIEPSSAMSKVVTERVPVFTSLQLIEPVADVNQEAHETEEGTGSSKPMSLFKMRRQQQRQQNIELAVTTSD